VLSERLCGHTALVDADGQSVYPLDIDAAQSSNKIQEYGAAPMVAEAIKTAFSGVKGMSGSGTISSRGFSKGFEFKAPSDSNPQARQIVDQMKGAFNELSAVLPEEAVGTGAKWEVKAPVQSHSIKIDQTANYELVSVEGETYKTKSTSTQRASNQKIDNPIMPGMKVDLTKWSGKSGSELGLDAGKLMPSLGTMEIHSEIGMGFNMGMNLPQNPSLIMKMDVSLKIEGK